MNSLRYILPVIGVLTLAAAGPTAAQQAQAVQRPELLTRLTACRAVGEATARLACYDAAAAAFDSAEREGDVVVVDRAQVSAARRQLFGFELPSMPGLFERGARPERIDAIESTLTRAGQFAEGKWVFTLADGSVWRQIDSEGFRDRVRPGQAVRVRRASLGSFLLTVDRSRAVRVRRQ